MAITVSKILPTSSWYSGSGATTITLSGIGDMTIHSKKDLIKVKILQSSGNANYGSDNAGNYVKDLKNIDFEMKLKGWLADTADSSAWTKMWQLRAMCTSGGPCSLLVVEDKTFNAGTTQPYLEDVAFIAHPNRVQGLKINETSSASLDVARIEADLSFYFAMQR